jgi:NADH dehydrogenase
VFVVGDAACVRTDAGEVPGVAQGAIQGAVHVANILSNKARGKTGTRAPFRYRDKGSMATIGRGSAVVATKRVARSGFFAWLFWWVIHIAYLVGFRNRLVVMFQWAWSFVTFARGSRLITGDTPALPPVHDVGSDGQLALPKAAALIDVNANPRRDA